MVNTVKFSQFSASVPSNTTNFLVGVSGDSGGINIKSPLTVSWTTALRPVSPYDGLLGYNTSLKAYEYWNAALVAWSQLSNSMDVGTVTSIDFNNGLTASPNPITTTGTAGLAPIPTISLLANTTGSTAIPVSSSLSSMIDASFGSANYSILYRGTSGWAELVPGLSGQFLQTQGVSGNPQWATPSGSGSVSPSTQYNLAYYSLAGTNAQVSGLATALDGVLVTNGSGIPSISNILPPFSTPTITVTSGYNQQLVNTTTTLNTSVYGKQVLLTGSSAYSVTLPSMASNTYFDFNCLTTSNALVTFLPPAGMIQLQSSFIVGSGESGRIYSDGTNYWIENFFMMPLNFSAYPSANQTISSTTVINIDTIIYDIGSFFNTTTHSYTPLYPGKYNVNFAVYWFGTTIGEQYEALIVKNSTNISLMENIAPFATTLSLSGSAIVSLNGSTDFITLKGAAGAAAQVYSASGTQPELTYFQAYRISNF